MENKELFEKFTAILPKAWTQESIYPGLIFDIGIPAKGQCEPTALVVKEWFGGDIYKITDDPSIAPKKTHYYNCIDGRFIDFTRSQFDNVIPYEKGIKLTEKQCSTLQNTSFCNRWVRYYCLSNRVHSLMTDARFEKISENEIDKYRSAIDLYIDVRKFLDNMPPASVIENADLLSELFWLMEDVCYNRETDDISNVIEYLENFLETGETPTDYTRNENPMDYKDRQELLNK